MSQPRLLAAVLTALVSNVVASATDTIAYVGGYTGAKSQGIYAFRVTEPAGGEPVFAPLGLVATITNPSFLAVDSARHLVFAVSETSKYNGAATGSVSAFSADPVTGKLTLINEQPSMGTSPCHVVLDPTGKFLLVANYSSGTVAVLPVALDGKLGAPVSVVQHQGHGPNASRQEGPHAHGVTFDPAGQYVFICDLGIDRIMAYRLDSAGKLTATEHPETVIKAGSGPRHLVFSPDARFAYVLNELTATVTVLDYDASTGQLTEQQTISALPADYTGNKSGAELTLDASGRSLYTSNRAHNSIAHFAVDPSTGALTLKANRETGGKTPRHFALLPSGKFMVIANQETDTLRLSLVDADSGQLQPVSETIATGAPTCVAFLVGK